MCLSNIKRLQLLSKKLPISVASEKSVTHNSEYTTLCFSSNSALCNHDPELPTFDDVINNEHLYRSPLSPTAPSMDDEHTFVEDTFDSSYFCDEHPATIREHPNSLTPSAPSF